MHWLDPDYLPKTVGTLARFVLNGNAEIDGLILADDTEIHTPPHLSAELAQALTVGSMLQVHGVKPRDGDVIVAVAIDPSNHARILDRGPEHAPPRSAATKARDEPVTYEGEIQRLLHGPRGQVHGALLKDGASVRWPPHATEAFADLLAVNAPLVVRGKFIATSIGAVIEAEAMGEQSDSLKAIPKPHDKKPPKHPKPDGHGRHH